MPFPSVGEDVVGWPDPPYKQEVAGSSPAPPIVWLSQIAAAERIPRRRVAAKWLHRRASVRYLLSVSNNGMNRSSGVSRLSAEAVKRACALRYPWTSQSHGATGACLSAAHRVGRFTSRVGRGAGRRAGRLDAGLSGSIRARLRGRVVDHVACRSRLGVVVPEIRAYPVHHCMAGRAVRTEVVRIVRAIVGDDLKNVMRLKFLWRWKLVAVP
jgi:hypothetical protein